MPLERETNKSPVSQSPSCVELASTEVPLNDRCILTVAPKKRGRRADTSGKSRDAILEAALQIVCEKGAGALTIEAVAERAGFSKGGVLYNFPTKEKLTQGMVEREVARFSCMLETERLKQGDCPSPTLAALVEVAETWIKSNETGPRGILLTHVSAPDLCEPFLAHKERLREEMIRETGHLARAMLIWTSLEGLLMSYAHGVMRFNTSELTLYFKELRELVRSPFLTEEN
ncbi:TetR/AcrR family transcriptional regulator [Roseibium sp.]|uniref:TetR/AcrR family transcriptional regulator n=1 Tax=Roseibium sp. TaxID=1936156 RepID=UPI003A978954